MHFCERLREDPGNLEMVRELYGSKAVGAIAGDGITRRKVAIMQTFRTAETFLLFAGFTGSEISVCVVESTSSVTVSQVPVKQSRG
jgi:hypothetical protein